ncbi:MAG: hypothetical protein AB9856_01130 [Cellulosilyticaceae bacterium]
MDIDYVHAPANNPNDLWRDCIDGDDYLNLLISCVDDCYRHNISTAVMHITRLSSKPTVSSIGLSQIKKLVDFAEKSKFSLLLKT